MRGPSRAFLQRNHVALVGALLLLFTLFAYWFALLGACVLFFTVGTLSASRRKLATLAVLYVGSPDRAFLVLSAASFLVGELLTRYHLRQESRRVVVPRVRPAVGSFAVKNDDESPPATTPHCSQLAARAQALVEREVYDRVLGACVPRYRQIPAALKQTSVAGLQTFLDELDRFLGSSVAEAPSRRAWNEAWSTCYQHIRLYRRIRKEAYREFFSDSSRRNNTNNTLSSSPDIWHLDDFNEFQGGGASSPLKKLEKNEVDVSDDFNIFLGKKLLESGVALPMIESEEKETAFLRELVDKIMDSALIQGLAKSSFESNLSRILFREFLVCKVIRPVVNKITEPSWINSFIADKCKNRLTIQTAIFNLADYTEREMSSFPPAFFQKYCGRPIIKSMIIDQKIALQEPLAKFLKRSQSRFDIQVMSFALASECKAVTKILEGGAGTHKSVSVDVLKEYLQIIEMYAEKYDRKLNSMCGFHFQKQDDGKQQKITLNAVLDEYFRTGDRNIADSSSVFYFLEYFQRKHSFTPKHGLTGLQLWRSTEEFRRLLTKLDIVDIPGKPKADVYPTLRSKAREILNKFFAEGSPSVIEFDDDSKTSLAKFANADADSDPLQNPQDFDYSSLIQAHDAICGVLDEEFDEFLVSDSFVQFEHENEKEKWVDAPCTLDDEDAEGEKISDILDVDRVPEAHFVGVNRFHMHERHYSQELLNSHFLNMIQIELDKIAHILETRNALFNTSTDEKAQSAELSKQIKDLYTRKQKRISDSQDSTTAQTSLTPGELVFLTSKARKTQRQIDQHLLVLDCMHTISYRYRKGFSLSPRALRENSVFRIIESFRTFLGNEVNTLLKRKRRFELLEINSLLVPGECVVNVTDRVLETTKSQDGRLKEVELFVIIIDRASDSAEWIVKRTMQDFQDLHRCLKPKYALLQDIDLPTMNVGFFSRNKTGLQTFLRALGDYIQILIDHTDICHSEEIRTFLSTSIDFHKFITRRGRFRTTRQKLNDIMRRNSGGGEKAVRFDRSNPILVENSSSAASRASTSAVENTSEFSSDDSSPGEDDIFSSLSSTDEDSDFDVIDGTQDWKLVDPVCSVLLQVFEFGERSPILRRNAALMLLRQVSEHGVPPERQIENLLSTLRKSSTPLLEFVLDILDESTTQPDSLLSPWSTTRKKPAQISRDDTRTLLLCCIPDSLYHKFSAQGAELGTRRIFDIFQSALLNKQFLYSLVQ